MKIKIPLGVNIAFPKDMSALKKNTSLVKSLALLCQF